MAGSDMDNEFEQLWRSLIRIKYKLPAMKDSSELPKENLREKLCKGDTAALLPIISYSLLVYSKRLSHYLIEKGYKIYGQSDTRFTDEVYKLVRNEFNYNPTLQSSQFLTVDGYAKSKLQFVNVILENAIKKAMKLKKEEKRAAMRKKSWHETELSKKIEDDLAKQKEEKKLKQEKEKEKEKTIKLKKQQNKGYQRSLKHLKSKSNTNTGNTTTNTTNSHTNTSGNNSTKQNSLSNSDSNSLKDENETARNNTSSMNATNAAVAAARQRIANMFNDKGEAKMPRARAAVGGMGGMGGVGNVGARHDGGSFCEIRKELPIPIGNEKTKNEKTMSKDNNNNNNNNNNNVKMSMSPRLHNTMIENEEKASEISDSELFGNGNGNGNGNGVTRGGTRMRKEPRHIKVDLDEALMVDFNDDNDNNDDDSNRNSKDKESDQKSYGQEEEENSVGSGKAKLEKRKKENENKSGLNVTSRMLLSSSYDPNDYDHSGLDATMETFHTRFNHLKSKSDKYDDFDSFYHGIDDSLFDGNHKNSEKKYANFAFSNENSNKNKSSNNSNSHNKNNNDTIVSMMSTIPENDDKCGVTASMTSMTSMTADDHKTENQSEKKTGTNNNNDIQNDENSEQKDKNENREQTGKKTNGETTKPNIDTNTNTNTNSHGNNNNNNNNNKDNENENENGIVGITRHDYGYSDNFLFSSSRFDKHMNEDDDDDDDIGGVGGIGSSTKEMKQDNDDDFDLTLWGTKIDINSHNDDIMGTSNNNGNNVNDLGVYGSGIGSGGIGGGIGGMNSPLYGSSRISGIGSGLGGIGGGIDSGASSRFLNRHNSISRGIGGGSGSLMGGIGSRSTTRTFGVGDTYMTSEATQLMLATIVSRLDNLETTIKDYAERTDARLTIMEGKIEFLENNKYQNENNQATKTRKENDSEQLKFEETDMLKSKTTLQDALKKESMTSNNYKSGLSGNSNSCQFDEMKEYKSNNDSDHAHSNNSNNTLITNMNVDSTVVSIPDFHFNDNINTTAATATATASATTTSSSRNQHESSKRNGNSSKDSESTIGSTPPVSSLTPGNKENSSDTVGSNSIEKTNNKENINNESQTKMTNNRNMIENKTRASIGENKKNPSNTTSNSKGNNNNNVSSKYDFNSLGLNYGLAFNTLKENVNTLNSSNNENNSSSSALWVSSLKPPQSPLLQKNGENSNNNRWTSNSRHIMSGYQSYSNTNDVPLHFMEFPLGSSSSSNNSFNHSNNNNNNGSSATNSNRHHSNHNESNNSGDSFEYDETVEFIKSLTQQMDATNRFLLRDPKTGENSSK